MTPTEEIKSRLDIVELIREYVGTLAQAGSSWKARCPFHEEKSPSFMVSQTKQVWHCFGCSEGGDHFSFVMKIENIEFPEALKMLAQKAGVTLPERQSAGASASKKERVTRVLETAFQWYQQQLQPANNRLAWEYMTGTRAIQPETLGAWQVGYAPSGWDNLSQYLSVQQLDPVDILDSGLVIERPAGSRGNFPTPYYDRFRGRIMFPIRDARGMLVGFGGRILPSAAAATPNTRAVVEEAKYMNTPQTILYDKRTVLYGIDQAKMAIRSANSVIILEGYMDVIASHQAGVANAVATCGTALTLEHLQLLKRFTQRVVLSFDMDLAGAAAAKRGIELLLRSEFKIGMLTIPEGLGKDADECIRNDAGVWKQVSAQFRPFVEVLWQRVTQGLDVSALPTQEKIGKEFLPILAQIKNPLEQSFWIKTLADTLGYSQPAIVQWIQSIRLPAVSAAAAGPKDNYPQKADRASLDIEHAFMGLLLLLGPEFSGAVKRIVEPTMLSQEEFRAWYGTQEPQGQMEQIPQGTPLYARVITAAEELYHHLEIVDRTRELERLARLIRRRYFQQELERIQRELNAIEHSGQPPAETDHLNTLLERAVQLTRELSAHPA
ncbi:DNA primase [Candidatus Uhrbacteria bacterium]|nr:DNA primase [Candidatus Uhrbacteria bacterium]